MYQSMPYDFTNSIRLNSLNDNFLENIKRLYKLTGKKVTVLSHSMGTLNAYY